MTWNENGGHGLGKTAMSQPRSENEARFVGMSPRQAEVLRANAIKPGEVKNKNGSNQWVKAQSRFREFAMQMVDEEHTRDDKVLLAIYESALIEGPRGAADRTLWHEHLRGRAPKIANDVEKAEHLRAVENDRVRTVIACLGSKLRTLSPVEMRDFFETCANDPEKFLIKSRQLIGDALEEQPEQQAQLPEKGTEGSDNG